MPPNRTSNAGLADSYSFWSIDRLGLILGPLGMIAWILFVDRNSLSPEAHRLAGIMILTIIWWVTEPIPIAATGILSVSLAVILHAVPEDGTGKVDAARTVLAPFGDPSVFFLMGGLFIGRAMTRHGLDRRMALAILCTRWASRSPFTVLAAVGLSVTLISMWISNTAATAMMYPVTLGIIGVLAAGRASQKATPGETPDAVSRSAEQEEQKSVIPATEFARSPYATSLLLITAYASAIGGVATPIGTATNVVAMSFFKREEFFGRPVDFLAWTAVGIPVMLALFVGLCVWLRMLTPTGEIKMAPLRDYLRTEYDRLGAWNRGEVNTLVVFLTVVGFWITPGILAIFFPPETRDAFARRFPEEIVAAMCPVLLFLAPVDWKRRQGTLDASDLMKIDWGTLLLFGAGLSLGGLMFKTGLAREVGDGIFAALGTRNVWNITAIAIVGGIVLSEFTSNAATATTLIPVTMTMCQQAGVDPIPPLFGVTLGASFGSALPVSTPPNAIVYSSGLILIRRMIVAGVGIDILSFVVIWLVLRMASVFHWTPFP